MQLCAYGNPNPKPGFGFFKPENPGLEERPRVWKPYFYRFVTMHACDGQTDGRTDRQNSPRYTVSALHAAR